MSCTFTVDTLSAYLNTRSFFYILTVGKIILYSSFIIDMVCLYNMDLCNNHFCMHQEKKKESFFIPEWLLNFGNPAAAVAHQVEHVFLRWERCAQWPPSSLELVPTEPGDGRSQDDAHTHSLDNHSSHSNKDSFSRSKEDFPAFHCNTGSIKGDNDRPSIVLLQQVCSDHVLKKKSALLPDASAEAS